MADEDRLNGSFGRSVRIDKIRVSHCLAELGWTNGELAKRVGVQTRTIERILQRGAASRKVYSEILQAIQTGLTEQRTRLGLINNLESIPESLEPAMESAVENNWNEDQSLRTLVLTDAAYVEITIDKDFDEFCERKQQEVEEVLSRIRTYLESKRRPEVIQIRKGSVKMTLRLSPEEAERLLWGVKRGELESIGVVDAESLDADSSDWLVGLGAEENLRQESLVESIAERSELPDALDRDFRWLNSETQVCTFESKYFALKKWPVRIAGAILLVLVSPLILLLVVLVRLTSPGPGLYRQVRTGFLGKEFMMYKIRTMYCDAEAVSGPVWCRPNDGRVTPLGRILRMLRIDDLPQLINVARGEMDLVGPRPVRPVFIRHLSDTIPNFSERFSVHPGITGLAQINLPPVESLDCVRSKVVLDCEYIREASFGLDLRILICTLLRTLGIRRAHEWLGLERKV